MVFRQSWRSSAVCCLFKVCFTTIKCLNWLPSLKLPSQLMLLIRLMSVPNLPSYRISHARDLPSAHKEARFFEISGRVVSMSLPEKYTEQARFVCSASGCNGSHVSVHVVGASEALTTSCNRQCPICGSSLQEDISRRILEDRVKFIMTCDEYGSSTQYGPKYCYRQQGVVVIIRKDLCTRVKLGSMVTVIGVPTYATTFFCQHLLVEITIEANNISTNFFPMDYYMPSIPTSILKIKEASSFSPWIFLQLLGYHFAMHICPPGCYHRLKTLLLLSLVCPSFNSLENAENYKSLDLLISGNDCTYLSNLLHIGSELSLSSVQHSSTNTLIAQQWNDSSTTYIDGGSLLFADKGICVIKHLEALKKDAKEKLHKTLDTNQLICNVFHQPGKLSSISWSKNCTVWAQISPQKKSGNEEYQEAVVPDGAIKKLIACAHAKINLRKEVIVEDAVLSILLCEESLASCFGYSTIGVQPYSHFKRNIQPGVYIGVEFHDYMNALHKQINEFCKYHWTYKFTAEE